MGQMIEGTWHSGWDIAVKEGAFQRAATKFHGRIAAHDGSSEERAASSDAPHPAEAGRYHLYVSYACPWAHRTLLLRALRGLEDAISVSVVIPEMGDGGWEFSNARPDALFASRYLHQIYSRADSGHTGRVTVPVLWDKRTNTIVNNESRHIMRMLDAEMDEFAKEPTTLAPTELLPEIDRALDALYEPLNNGVYRAGFSTTQAAYEHACRGVFESLGHWEQVLGKQMYICGNVLTEADVALFTTLLRFDLVYYSHFKCNLRRIADMPNLSRFLHQVYNLPKVKDTCHLDEIKRHYYWSQTSVNPSRVVPLGPEIRL